MRKIIQALILALPCIVLSFSALAACPGCCSGHGGVSSSCGSSGKVICMDGTTSPSCTCSKCGVATTTTPSCTPTTSYRDLACAAGMSGKIREQRNYACITSATGSWGYWEVIENTCVSNSLTGRVIAVSDGDTLTFLDAENISHKVRLAEIDAPEKCQAYGVESKNSLVALALNKEADLAVDTKDKYGREVGKITVTGQAETANKMQLRLGMAWVYDQYATDTSLDSLELSARQSNLGLWADANPMEPWVWRHGSYGCSRDPETNGTSVVVDTTGTSGTSGSGVEQAIVVTEFFNHNLKHYFLTASESEAIGIDNGAAGEGWERTGNTFQAWRINTTVADAVAVCRFYAKGPNSHFFTADPSECQALRDMESTGKADAEKAGVPFLGWQYEGADFKVKIPVSGTCATETETIYRAYNNRASQGDTNHRFSPWQQDIDSLQTQGWVSEGAAMCAPM